MRGYSMHTSLRTTALILRSRALARRLEGWPRAPVADPSRRGQEAAPLAITAKPLRGDEDSNMNSAIQQAWPELPYAAWRDTSETLHLMTQIVGKIRLVRTPWLNHSWHVALYVTARGLTTSPIPDGARSFQIDFDFLDHALR